MAKDLGTSLTPYEFENMLPLDVLAAVASETLRNEIHTDDVPEKKVTTSLKKQLKKSNPSVMTFDDIKSLPMKTLVDKFSEMTSDELTKKYSYKCLLLPQKCSMAFKSFGNEKKACDKIKSHLLSHLQQITLEQDSNEELSAVLFTPKSPNSFSKQTEKLCKKSLKKRQILLSQALTCKPHKSPKKIKNSSYCLKKIKSLQSPIKTQVGEFSKWSKNKKIFNSVYLKGKSGIKKSNNGNLNYDSKNENILSTDVKIEIPAESDFECDSRKYNSYSEHLKNTFLSEAFFQEDFDNESLVNSDETSNFNDCDISHEENSSDQSVTSFNSKSSSFLQDHNYPLTDETKCDKLSQEFKHFPRKNITSVLYKPTIKPQLIIRTPPFPFVHTPLLPEVAEIKEIDLEDVCHSDKPDRSNCYDYLCDDTKVKYDVEDEQSEHLSEPEEKYSATLFYKISGASGSVLECVENIVNNKYSNTCVPKSEIPASENDENLENLQRIEKELALKYIAKLHAKKKKRIPDSLICQICPDKHFTAQATLIHHYRSHAGIKPYVCKICSATFTRQHSLNYHMLIHQNLSRFTCEFCGRTFRHPSHYKEHLRRHTGETPYHCTDCNLHFKTRNTFKRHLKTRHAKLLTASGIEDLTVEEYAKFNPKNKLGK